VTFRGVILPRYPIPDIPIDRDTDKPRGFGFITFADSRDAKEAVAEMHEKELSGRHVSVNLARPRGEGGGRSGGGYGGSGGSRSSGGGFRDSGRDRGDRGSYDKYGGYIGGRSGDRGGDRGDRGDRSYLR